MKYLTPCLFSDYHNPRNDQRGNNRFQDKGEYSAGNQNT